MERVIKVSAKGVKRVQPDTIVIKFTVKAQDANYDDMLKLSEEQLFAMQNVVELAGFKEKAQNAKLQNTYCIS